MSEFPRKCNRCGELLPAYPDLPPEVVDCDCAAAMAKGIYLAGRIGIDSWASWERKAALCLGHADRSSPMIVQAGEW